jgi:parallel beta-helix repeat protein
VWQNARSNAGSRRDKENWPGALMIVDTEHGIIEGNEVYRNHGEGIIYLRSTDGVIQDNICWDNLKVQLYLDNAARCLVRRNLCYNTDDKEFWRWAPNNPGYGLFIANESYSGRVQVMGKDVTIVNNIIFRTGNGLSFWTENGLANSALRGYVIANNTIYATTKNGINLGGTTTSHDAKLCNNIIHSTGRIIKSDNWSGLDFKNNCWKTSPPSRASSGADVIGDPRISAQGSTAGGEVTTEYFTLGKGSPCIDAGRALSEVTEDFLGGKRGAKPDIGAHEYRATTSVCSKPAASHTRGANSAMPTLYLLSGRATGLTVIVERMRAANALIVHHAGYSAKPRVITR